MAVTYANTEIIFRSTYTIMATELTFDTSYATGGEAITAASFGLREIKWIIPGSCEGFDVEVSSTNAANWLIQLYAFSASTNTALETASGVDRSAVSVDLLIIGR